MKRQIFEWIDANRALAVELEKELTKRPALSPDSGGEGELEKAEFLQEWLSARGITALERHDAPDSRAKGGVRPNLIATIAGSAGTDGGPRLWIISHLDVVPPGDLSLWRTDPWTAIEQDGRLIGRGVEDNQQGLCASALAALALLNCGAKPARTVKLLFAADEECGSVYGVEWLLKNRAALFSAKDMVLAPDSGARDGLAMEVAEKNMLWLRVETHGKQAHASRPDLGVNAHFAGAEFALALRKRLRRRFNKQDALFEPPYSTFELTKKEPNVPNVNTIPGEDALYFDMRVLPRYPNSAVLREVERVKGAIEKKHGVSIGIHAVQTHESKATSPDAPLARLLAKQIGEVYGGKARAVGIGGGTVGAFLRNAGIDTVVWSRLEDTAHQPNEYALIDNISGDAKVMAGLMLE